MGWAAVVVCLKGLSAKTHTVETGQHFAMSSTTTRYRLPVTMDEPSCVFIYRKMVFLEYDDQSEPRRQVGGPTMYFTLNRS